MKLIAKYTTLTALALIGAAHADSVVIAKVGDVEVKADEVKSWLSGLDANQKQAAKDDPKALSDAIRALLTQKLILKEADEKKWAEQPEVQAKLARQRDALVSESYLRSVSDPGKEFPTEEQLHAAYDAAGDSLKLPRRYQLAQIFIASPKGDAKDKAAEVAEVKKLLAAPGADFAAIARAHSEEPATAAKGGEIGWLLENQIQEGIRAEVTKLDKGKFTAPLQLNDGWHFVKVLNREEARKLTFDEVKGKLAERLREQQTLSNSKEFVAKLLQDHPIVINEVELPKIIGN
jgi:parvulin-like peptidyl-prolyl isomerase